MAARYYGINMGDDAKFVAEGSSTNTTDIEVVIADTTKPWTKQQAVILLEKIQRHILDNKTFPLK